MDKADTATVVYVRDGSVGAPLEKGAENVMERNVKEDLGYSIKMGGCVAEHSGEKILGLSDPATEKRR